MAPREIVSMTSMRCDICQIYVRSFDGQLLHSRRTSHNEWVFSEVEVRGLRCAECGKLCGSERVADSHDKSVGHKEFRKSGLREVVPPKLLKTLTGMGYSEARAARAYRSCDTEEVDHLINWLTTHDDNIDTPQVLPDMKEWSNVVTDEMKLLSRNLRLDALKRVKAGKSTGANVPIPELFPKRLLKHEVTLSDKKLEELKKMLLIAEDLDDPTILVKIKKLLEGCDPDNGDYSFRLPSRSDD